SPYTIKLLFRALNSHKGTLEKVIKVKLLIAASKALEDETRKTKISPEERKKFIDRALRKSTEYEMLETMLDLKLIEYFEDQKKVTINEEFAEKFKAFISEIIENKIIKKEELDSDLSDFHEDPSGMFRVEI
ncbi:MAG: hypothetical protein V3S46_01350, partial [Nitrospinota bacterium]